MSISCGLKSKWPYSGPNYFQNLGYIFNIGLLYVIVTLGFGSKAKSACQNRRKSHPCTKITSLMIHQKGKRQHPSPVLTLWSLLVTGNTARHPTEEYVVEQPKSHSNLNNQRKRRYPCLILRPSRDKREIKVSNTELLYTTGSTGPGPHSTRAHQDSFV